MRTNLHLVPRFLNLNIEIKTVQNVLGESLLVDFKFNSDLQYEFLEIYHTTPQKLIGYFYTFDKTPCFE